MFAVLPLGYDITPHRASKRQRGDGQRRSDIVYPYNTVDRRTV